MLSWGEEENSRREAVISFLSILSHFTFYAHTSPHPPHQNIPTTLGIRSRPPYFWTHILYISSNHYTTSEPIKIPHESSSIAYRYVHLHLHMDMHICCPVTATKPRDLGHTFNTNHIHPTNYIILPQHPRCIIQDNNTKNMQWPLGAPDQLHSPRLIQTRNPDLFHHSIIIFSSLVSSHIIMDRHVTYPLPPCAPDHLCT